MNVYDIRTTHIESNLTLLPGVLSMGGCATYSKFKAFQLKDGKQFFALHYE